LPSSNARIPGSGTAARAAVTSADALSASSSAKFNPSTSPSPSAACRSASVARSGWVMSWLTPAGRASPVGFHHDRSSLLPPMRTTGRCPSAPNAPSSVTTDPRALPAPSPRYSLTLSHSTETPRKSSGTWRPGVVVSTVTTVAGALPDPHPPAEQTSADMTHPTLVRIS
jgi:hypothetical protein